MAKDVDKRSRARLASVEDRLAKAHKRLDRGERFEGFEMFNEAKTLAEAGLAEEPLNVGLLLAASRANRRAADFIAEFGQHDIALMRYEESLAFAHRAAALDKADAVRIELARSIQAAGDGDLAAGRIEDAAKRYDSVLELTRSNLASNPDIDEGELDVCRALFRVGRARTIFHQPVLAIAAYEEALLLSERLSAAAPKDVKRAQNIVFCQLELASIRTDLGDAAGGLAASQAAAVLARKLARRDKRWREIRRDLINALHGIVAVEWSAGNLTAALEALEERSEIEEQMRRLAPDGEAWIARRQETEAAIADLRARTRAPDRPSSLFARIVGKMSAPLKGKADPDRSKETERLVTLHLQLGRNAVEAGELQAAIEHFKTACAHGRTLIDRSPSEAEALHLASRPHAELGDALKRAGDRAGSLTEFKVWRALAARAADLDPGNGARLRQLSVAIARIATSYQELGDRDSAMAQYREALAIGERLVKAEPKKAGHHDDLARTLTMMGSLAIDSGDHDEAEAYLQRALRIEQQLATITFGNSETERGVMLAKDLLGHLAIVRGRLSVALELYEDALAIARRIAVADSNIVNRRSVGVALSRVADVLEKRGEDAAALKRRLEALTVFQALVAFDDANALWRNDKSIEEQQVAQLRARLGSTG